MAAVEKAAAVLAERFGDRPYTTWRDVAEALSAAGLLAADPGEARAEASEPYRVVYDCPFCKDWQVDYLVADHPGTLFIEAVLAEHVLECPSSEAIPAAVRAGAKLTRLAF